MSSISKKEAGAARGQAKNLIASEALDGTTTTDVVKLPIVAERITVQSTGTLAGSIDVSLDGENWSNNTVFTANTMVTFSSHNVASVRVNRTGGEGKLIIAAV